MLNDIRYALRSLLRTPSSTSVAVLSIALGVGANCMMFSLADALLLRPLQVKNANAVVSLRSQLKGQDTTDVSYPDFIDYQKKSKSFEGLTAYTLSPFGFAADKKAAAEMKAGLLVSGNFFRVLQVPLQAGRDFSEAESTIGGRQAVAIISSDLWQSHFESDKGVVGRPVYLNGIEFTVIGVAPKSFTGVDQYFRPQVYVPLAMSAELSGQTGQSWLNARDDRRLSLKGRLRSGVSAKSATAEVRVIAAGLASSYPNTNRDWSGTVQTEMQRRVEMSPFDAILVGLLLGLAAVVLVIACANVANLTLSRSLARTSEIAIRIAVGAGRMQLITQLLVESLLLSLVAGGIGIFLAELGMSSFMPWTIPSEIPIQIDAKVDQRVMLYALCACVISALVCGLIPALRASSVDIESALRAGAKGMETKRRFWGRDVLVVAQVACSLFLMVCATQLYSGISYVLKQPPKFRSSHILMASFDPTLVRYDDAKTKRFYKDLNERASHLPGVVSASLTELVPMANHADGQMIVPEGYQLPPSMDSLSVYGNIVSDDYFNTIGIPILHGRPFDLHDTPESQRVAIVNEYLAKKYFPNQDAVGKRFRLGGPKGEWVQIVGVAKESVYAMVVEPPLEVVYLPYAQNYRSQMTLMVQTAGPSDMAAAPLRDLVRSINPDQPLLALRSMEQYVYDRGTKTLTLVTSFVAGMGLLGLTLALSGLYAVMAWSVTRRIREIGIRMAVGADRVSVLGMVMKQGLKLSAIGIGIGVVLSVVFSKGLTAGTSIPSFNIPILLFVCVALLMMAMAGAYFPARRASRLDPIRVLREE